MRWVTLLLPEGKSVALQGLRLCSPCYLPNLGSVAQLTSLWFRPYNLALVNGEPTINWPCYFPSLKCIALDVGLYCDNDFDTLPPEWQQYTNLQELILPPYNATELPSWFSNLQELTHLDFRQNSLVSLNVCHNCPS